MRSLVESICQEIRNDRTASAVELVKRGIDAVALSITQFGGEASTFFDELVRISKILIESQPSMAPFFQLANTLLLAAEGHTDIDQMKQATKEAVKGFLAHLQNSAEEISRIARGLIPKGSRVLTHSHSSVVLKALVDAKKEGKQFEVVCTESRPNCEGLQMARKLYEAGVKVQVQTDSAAMYSVKDVDLVLVGADCLTPFGLVNKVGTYGLALCARERKVHFYALCGTEKLLGSRMAKKYRILRRNPDEIWVDRPEEVEIFNFYDDITPLDLLTAIFTEEGMIRGGEILRRFQTMKVSSHFPS